MILKIVKNKRNSKKRKFEMQKDCTIFGMCDVRYPLKLVVYFCQ